jgi:tryptophan synthase beta subunit
MGFIPPYSKRLLEIAMTGKFPALKRCEVHLGSEDWQSNPENVKQFATLLGLNVNEVKDAGHSLPKDYVSAQLDRWLG